MLTRQTSPGALREALVATGFSNGHGDLSLIWPALKQWLALPVARDDARLQVLGFECGLNRSSDGREDHPELPEGLASRPMFYLSVFRVFDDAVDREGSGQDEHGVEWWYLPDEEWDAIAARDDWDHDHHIGYHFWGFGHAAMTGFLHQVEETPMYGAALRKSAQLTRAFGLDADGGEIVASNVRR